MGTADVNGEPALAVALVLFAFAGFFEMVLIWQSGAFCQGSGDGFWRRCFLSRPCGSAVLCRSIWRNETRASAEIAWPRAVVSSPSTLGSCVSPRLARRSWSVLPDRALFRSPPVVKQSEPTNIGSRSYLGEERRISQVRC